MNMPPPPPPPPPGPPPQYEGYNPQYQPSAKTNGMAIAGFVLSFFCGILGLIFSAVALSQISKTGQGGKGLAIAGLVISIVSMIAGFAVVAGGSGSGY